MRFSAVSLSARRAWIEIETPLTDSQTRTSLSARRAWIEIVYPGTWSGSILVALRKESVDRNTHTLIKICLSNVALRKESVDRNYRYPSRCVVLLSSLSARRAWIEIPGA